MHELAEEAGDWRPPATKREKTSEAGVEVAVDEVAVPSVRPQATVKALCVAADDDSDHAVAVMAAQVLRRVGFETEVVAPATLTGELSELVGKEGIRLVLISDVPPSGFAHVRYICKRLAARFPEIPIIVAVWGSNLDANKAAERLPEVTTLRLAKSLREAVDAAQELFQGLQLDAAAAEDGSTPAARGPGGNQKA